MHHIVPDSGEALADILQESDLELVTLCRSSSGSTAWNTLRTRHAGMIQAAVNRAVKDGCDREDAESVAGTLFMAAVQKYDPGAGAKFSTYLHTRLRGVLRAMRLERHKQPRPGRIDRSQPGTTAVDNADADDAIRKALESFPARQRAVITATLDGLNQVQIAESLGLTESQVSRSYHFAVARLQEVLR